MYQLLPFFIFHFPPLLPLLLPPLLFLVSALPKDMASSTLKTLLMHSKLCKHSRQAGCSLSLPRYPRYCHHIYLTCDAHWSCCYVSTGVHCNNCGTLSHTQSSLWSSGICWFMAIMFCVNFTFVNFVTACKRKIVVVDVWEWLLVGAVTDTMS